jgi:hypothetical protein
MSRWRIAGGPFFDTGLAWGMKSEFVYTCGVIVLGAMPLLILAVALWKF